MVFIFAGDTLTGRLFFVEQCDMVLKTTVENRLFH